MGFLTRDASPKTNRSAVTIIAEGNKFSGEMSIVGKLHIDGLFEGKISSLDSISIGQRGKVQGIVKAQRINVCGALDGEVFCEELNIENGGQVSGVVHSEQMTIEQNGSFVGERRIRPAIEPAGEKQSTVEQLKSDKPRELDVTFQDLPDRVRLSDKD